MKAPAKLTAAEILEREYGTSKNGMTPHVLSQVLLGSGVAAELSEGVDPVKGGPLFGVSVAVMRADGTTYRPSMKPEEPIRPAVFGARKAAESHVQAMREHLSRGGPVAKECVV